MYSTIFYIKMQYYLFPRNFGDKKKLWLGHFIFSYWHDKKHGSSF